MKGLHRMKRIVIAGMLCLMCAGCNADALPEETPAPEKRVIVLDAGHGKSSLMMSDEEKTEQGYEYNEGRKSWGEWRHYKNGTFGEDCHGTDCTHLSPDGGSCWYAMGYGDRETEPEINLMNALAAKKYLEEMGWEVRMTRTSNEENPSMNKRVSYCFPDNDITKTADASAYICIHSNASGGRGTSYIELSGEYEQSGIAEDYAEKSNQMGEIINDAVSAAGFMKNPPIQSPNLILFNKSPVPIAYLEIGFYDNEGDLEILKSSSDKIGKAIALGVNKFLSNE